MNLYCLNCISSPHPRGWSACHDCRKLNEKVDNKPAVPKVTDMKLNEKIEKIKLDAEEEIARIKAGVDRQIEQAKARAEARIREAQRWAELREQLELSYGTNNNPKKDLLWDKCRVMGKDMMDVGHLYSELAELIE